MADRPILFSGPMVRALLDGRKTQTRRVLSGGRMSLFNGEWSDSYVLDPGNADWRQRDVRFAVGDRLWVRETWSHTGDGVFEIRQARIAPTGRVIYAATPAPDAPHAKYWPSIHMPREFSRMTLAVTDVRVERLQDISEADAIAEGVEDAGGGIAFVQRSDALTYSTPTGCYAALWNDLNVSRGYGWDANPWVVAVSFEVVKANIDRMAASPHSPLQDRDGEVNRG